MGMKLWWSVARIVGQLGELNRNARVDLLHARACRCWCVATVEYCPPRSSNTETFLSSILPRGLDYDGMYVPALSGKRSNDSTSQTTSTLTGPLSISDPTWTIFLAG
jgi:hypothetical protein